MRGRSRQGRFTIGAIETSALAEPPIRKLDSGETTPPTLSSFVARLVEAADEGNGRVFSEAEHCFAELTKGAAEIVVNTAGLWRSWRHLDSPEEDPETGAVCLAEAFPDSIVLPIREGTIAVLLDRLDCSGIEEELSALTNCVALALDVGTGRATAARSVNELHVLRAVAKRILETHDLDEILLLVSHETKRLLAADICGVMFCEADEVVMKSCVGHFSPIMPKLRMQSGVGVAGQVLATGEACMVSNYVESANITRDFVPLARLEKVRSALAVPILSRDAIIGVLEVWRRRPSVFKPEDTALLHALAGLASIAIDNALLLRAHADAAARLTVAYGELTERYAVITSASSFQERLASLMLVELSLPRILGLTSEFTEATVFFLDSHRNVECVEPATAGPSDEQLRPLQDLLTKFRRAGDAPFVTQLGERLAYVLPIVSGVEALGWLVWLGSSEPEEMIRLALRHVALAVGLYCFERRRLARERVSTLENVMWGLLEGDLVDRAVAHDRARELKVQIRDSIFVVVISLPASVTSSSAELDPVWHEKILSLSGPDRLGSAVLMAGVRGSHLCLICKGNPDAARLAVLNGLRERLKSELRATAMPMGLSGVHNDWRSLPAAFREAVVALEVAKHRRGDHVANYHDIGVLGLLVSLRNKADLRRVGEEILGGLLKEPEPSRKMLLGTLQAFFDCNCSQGATAERLHVHNKTVSYRLEKISSLTGLNFARHQDRVLADLGIRMMTLIDDAN